MANKDKLLEDAHDLGVADAAGMTKAQLEEAIESRAPARLGPVVPEGESGPEPLGASGSATVGVQPVEPGDIPEAGR